MLHSSALESSGRHTRQRVPRRGMVLILVMVVIAILCLGAMTYSELMLTEHQASRLSTRQAQARALADSGVAMARLFLATDEETLFEAGGWYDNADRFQGVLVLDSEQARDRGRFALVAPRVEEGQYGGIRFGLEDESTRLNLNTLLLADQYAENGGREVLMALPGMTEEIADAILDWIDLDDEPREYGAEVEYYSSLVPPYAAKNGNLETVEELLLVRDITPWLLFGADANRNGRADSSEPDPSAIPGVDNSDGTLDRGWAAYLTLFSQETNLTPEGGLKIHLNQDDMETLYAEAEEVFGSEKAAFIVGYRQSGPYEGNESGEMPASDDMPDLSQPGKTPLKTVLDLVGARIRIKLEGDKKPTVLESPFVDLPGVMATYLPELMDYATATQSPIIPGRININQAPRVILAGIPNLTEEAVEEILSRRAMDPADAEPHRGHETWILSEGIVTLDQMKAMMPFVTGGGNVFRGQVVGYFDDEGPSARVEVVLDATASPARLVSWRNLSHLGQGYPRETLGIEAPEW